MKVYAFGEKDRPALVLLPGTCCRGPAATGRGTSAM